MKICIAGLLLTLGLLLNPAWSATCKVGLAQQATRPQWIDNAGNGSGDDKFYGVGVSEIFGSDISRSIGAARTQANAELAQSIRVSITSSVKSAESRLTENGKTAVQSKFETISDSVANLTLQSVVVDGQWIDPEACRLWLRVSVSRAEAQRAQRQETSARLAQSFDVQIALAESFNESVPQRERALAAAAEMLKSIEPTLVPTFSVDAAESRLIAARSTVADSRNQFASYGAQLSAHLKAYGQLGASTAATPRRTAATSALNALHAMKALAPNGMPGLPMPFDLTERMSMLFGELGIPCMARQWFAEHGRPLPGNLQSPSPSCSPMELGRERRQLYLAGRTMQLSCSISLDGKPQAWEKVCASMQEKMTRDGANVTTTGSVHNADSLHKLTVSATGVLKKRVDAETQTTFYRFEGVILTTFKGPDNVDIQDRYEGITGWNPVSAAMTTDVLALNVVSRFDAVISKNWEK